MQINRREKLKKRHVEWLLNLERSTGLKLHKIAAEAGLAPSTLYNASNPESSNVLSSDTIDKLTARFGVPAPFDHGSQNGSGFNEAEAVLIPAEDYHKDLQPCTETQSVWRLRTRALELPPYGYQPGDEVLLDESLTSPAGYDVVCANTTHGKMVWRVFVPPFYLLTATADRAIPATPLVVHHDATIVGTVIRSVRRRS